MAVVAAIMMLFVSQAVLSTVECAFVDNGLGPLFSHQDHSIGMQHPYRFNVFSSIGCLTSYNSVLLMLFASLPWQQVLRAQYFTAFCGMAPTVFWTETETDFCCLGVAVLLATSSCFLHPSEAVDIQPLENHSPEVGLDKVWL